MDTQDFQNKLSNILIIFVADLEHKLNASMKIVGKL